MLNQSVAGNGRRKLTIDIQPGEYALIATIHNDFRLFTPGFDLSDAKAALSKSAIALIAVAERLSDDEWVEELIRQYTESTQNE